MTQQPARRGRPRDPWNQTAIARLRRGDNPAAVRHQWRLAYAQGAGYPPDQTETGEPKLWRMLVLTPSGIPRPSRASPRHPWNQTAIDRLRRGDNPAAVRHQWRLDYAQGTGLPPDQTVTGEPKLWQTLIIRPYRTQPTTTTQETHQETHP